MLTFSILDTLSICLFVTCILASQSSRPSPQRQISVLNKKWTSIYTRPAVSQHSPYLAYRFRAAWGGLRHDNLPIASNGSRKINLAAALFVKTSERPLYKCGWDSGCEWLRGRSGPSAVTSRLRGVSTNRLDGTRWTEGEAELLLSPEITWAALVMGRASNATQVSTSICVLKSGSENLWTQTRVL